MSKRRGPLLTAARAREMTAGLREAMDDVQRSVAVLAARVRDAHAARVWAPFGYPSWEVYCDAVLGGVCIASVGPLSVVFFATARCSTCPSWTSSGSDSPPVATTRPRNRRPSQIPGRAVRRCIGRLDYGAVQRTVSKTARPCLFM
ncbi:hypothetical protein GCM10010377_80430 [Streptomyces viridiviolaceus]|nr:hypothetical protein GCM10010377_80430 [Streptomyces viridiviolaceus]